MFGGKLICFTLESGGATAVIHLSSFLSKVELFSVKR